MSLEEILVVLVVAILVMKPQDIAVIIKQLKRFKHQIRDMQNTALSYIDDEFKKIDEVSQDNLQQDDVEEINFYLEKIINIDGKYEGDYSAQHIKAKYRELIQQKIDESKEITPAPIILRLYSFG